MTETERNQIKDALLKCAEENENKFTLTGHIVVSSLCKSAVERIAELEKENIGLKTKIIALENANRAMLKELDNMTSGGIGVLKTVVRNKEKLIRAKEIIEGLMRFCRCFAQHYTEDIRYKEAEQFLREVEQ